MGNKVKVDHLTAKKGNIYVTIKNWLDNQSSLAICAIVAIFAMFVMFAIVAMLIVSERYAPQLLLTIGIIIVVIAIIAIIVLVFLYLLSREKHKPETHRSDSTHPNVPTTPVNIEDIPKELQPTQLKSKDIPKELQPIQPKFDDISNEIQTKPENIAKEIQSRVRKFYGFANGDNEKKQCYGEGCKKEITWQNVVDSLAFYDVKNKTFLCLDCLSKKTILVLHSKNGPQVYITSDEGLWLDRQLAKGSNPEKMKERMERAQKGIQEIVSDYLLHFQTIERTGNYFMRKQYRPGVYLENLLIAEPFTWQQTVYVLVQISHALEALHTKKYVHRAVSSRGIWIDTKGKVYLGNFPLCKEMQDSEDLEPGLTQIDSPLGFIKYMSPEQIEDAAGADQRTDIWACGVLGYHLLTRNFPFSRETNAQILYVIRHNNPDWSDKLRELKPILEKCLQKKPEDRYQSAKEMRKALLEIIRYLWN